MTSTNGMGMSTGDMNGTAAGNGNGNMSSGSSGRRSRLPSGPGNLHTHEEEPGKSEVSVSSHHDQQQQKQQPVMSSPSFLRPIPNGPWSTPDQDPTANAIHEIEHGIGFAPDPNSQWRTSGW